MKLKSNAVFSFIAVFIIYVLAVIVGIVVYNTVNLAFYYSLLIADVSATVFVFIFSLIFENSSVYDPYWSVQPPVIMACFAIQYGLNAYTLCLFIAVCFWAIRLTANWAYCFKNLTCQDWRYTMLKEKSGKWYFFVNFTGIHLVPTLIVFFCILPAVFGIVFDLNYNAWSFVFCGLAVLSAVMQGIADIEMQAFRKHKSTPFIRKGLWKYSRHPNYLGEICIWWCVGLSVVVANPSRFYLLVGALLNTLMFLGISIPLAEKRQSKKEGYAEYRKQTRVLFPIYKKSK